MMTMIYCPSANPGVATGLLLQECRERGYEFVTNKKTGPHVIEIRDGEERVAKWFVFPYFRNGSRIFSFPGIYRRLQEARLRKSFLKSVAYTKPSGLV